MKIQFGALSPAKRLWNLLKLDRAEIRNIYFYSVLGGIISLSVPLGIQAIVNFIQVGQISTSWIVLVTGVIVGIMVVGILQIIQLRISENLQQKMFIRNAFDFANIIPAADWNHISNKSSELMNRFLDITTVQKGISKLILDFSSASLQIIFGLILLSFYHPFFIALGILFIVLFVMMFTYHFREGIKTSLNESKHKYKILSWFEEMAANIPMVKTNIHSDYHLKKTDMQVMQYLEAREDHFKVLRKKYYTMIGLKMFMISGLLIIGGLLVIYQKMNLGQFIASEVIIILLMSSIEKLMNILEVLYDVLTALVKLGEVTDLKLEKNDGLSFPVLLPESNYHFKVAAKSVDSDFIEANEKDFILLDGNPIEIKRVMDTWAGLNDSSHHIIYNEISLSSFSLSDYRKNVYYSRNRFDVFEGTLLENITINNGNATIEQLEMALNYSGLKNEINRLSGGLHHEMALFNREEKLCAKIGLARAFLSASPITVFYESFNHFTADEIRTYLEGFKKHNNGFVLVFTNQTIQQNLFNKTYQII
jgi:ABC-type bacteriocin/lantibiotic exporter with double-glycine peptidase domain